MVRTMLSRVVCWTTLLSLAVVFATAEQGVLRADGPVKKAMAKEPAASRGTTIKLPRQTNNVRRLTRFKRICPKIAKLQAELKALREERDEKIAAVLTPEQKKQLEEAKARQSGKGEAEGGKTGRSIRPNTSRRAAPANLAGANAAKPLGCALPRRG